MKKRFDQKYGRDNYPKGPHSEFFQIALFNNATNSFNKLCFHRDNQDQKYVFEVSHIKPIGIDLDEEPKSIGSYSSYKKAKDIVKIYRKYKGFARYQNRFFIDRYEIDKEYWQEGYYTVTV